MYYNPVIAVIFTNKATHPKPLLSRSYRLHLNIKLQDNLVSQRLQQSSSSVQSSCINTTPVITTASHNAQVYPHLNRNGVMYSLDQLHDDTLEQFSLDISSNMTPALLTKPIEITITIDDNISDICNYHMYVASFNTTELYVMLSPCEVYDVIRSILSQLPQANTTCKLSSFVSQVIQLMFVIGIAHDALYSIVTYANDPRLQVIDLIAHVLYCILVVMVVNMIPL